MKSMLFVMLAGMLAGGSAKAGAEVSFVLEQPSVRQARGLGAAWNDKASPLRIHVGDVLLFTNNDTQPHVIHTDNGAPFPHGSVARPIRPGSTARIPIVKPYDSFRAGPLYDHYIGATTGEVFWIVAE